MMDSAAEAVNYYHDLLQTWGASTFSELQEAIVHRKLSFGQRPTCNVLRPFFLKRTTYEQLIHTTTKIVRAISELFRRLQVDPKLRQEMVLTPEEEEIIQVPTGYGAPDVSSRLDGFLSSSGKFQFVEYNADSPGGIAYGDELVDLFLQMPILQAFQQKFPVSRVPVRKMVLDRLVECYRSWGGKKRPNIAIVDWRDSPTYNEFLLMEEFFQRNGYQAKFLDPSELEFRNGKLVAGDFSVDLVYKRLLVGDILKTGGMKHPIVRAAKEGTVCVANGFAVQMLFKKTLFVLLSDPECWKPEEAEIEAALREHIPWSRRVKEGKSTYRDRKIDLVEFIFDHQQNLVLKPVGEYGGKGVLLGWKTTKDEWSRGIQTALREPYIVQEKVEIGQEIFPTLVEGRWEFASRYFDLDPYVWSGKDVAGCGIRLSGLELLNVSAGSGSATPLLILEP